MTQIVSLSFFRFDRAVSKLWAFAMMGAARGPMARIPDLGFWKLFGSGTGEGFTPRPNTAVYAILCTWPDRATAQARLDSEDVFQRYRATADETWTVFLRPVSSRGFWSASEPFSPSPDPVSGPIAALTRATLRPRIALQFWQHVPDISKVIGDDPNVLFKIGVGEVPWLQQVTFSNWPDTASMANFARKDGPHAKAIRAVREGGWFREELYARFAVEGALGEWEGQKPLDPMEVSL